MNYNSKYINVINFYDLTPIRSNLQYGKTFIDDR